MDEATDSSAQHNPRRKIKVCKDQPNNKHNSLMDHHKRLSYDRRMGVSAESNIEDMTKFEKKVIPKDVRTKAELHSSLKSNMMFRYLEANECMDLYNAMFPVEFAPGEFVIRQGDDGDNFYFISEGTAEVYKDKQLVKTLTVNDIFGELALIYNQPRVADVKAKTKLKLWALDRYSYRHILMENTIRKRNLYNEFLKKVPLLNNLDGYERASVADALEEISFQANEEIIRQGDQGDFFYIIVEGTASVLIRPPDQLLSPTFKKVATLGPSAYFGELALLFDKPRAATIIANEKVKCVRLDRSKFERLLGSCADILKRNMDAYNVNNTKTK